MNLQAQYPSREDQAKAEIGVTRISRGAAICAMVIFLVTIVAVSVIDQAAAKFQSWRMLGAGGDLKQTLHEFENTLEDESAFARSIRPLVQTGLTRGLSSGSEKVDCGRDGWLFYELDVRH